MGKKQQLYPSNSFPPHTGSPCRCLHEFAHQEKNGSQRLGTWNEAAPTFNPHEAWKATNGEWWNFGIVMAC